ncbi:Sec-independent protein translocase TatB [Corynebacterium striatum]
MFSSIGWLEIAFIVLIGIVVIGPERLPGVITDIRAAIYAARKAINNAKAELEGDLSGLGEEFDSLRGPISQAAEWTRMGPRGVITKALFDGDESAWDDFDPKKMTEGLGKPAISNQPQQPASGTQSSSTPTQNRPTFDYSQVYAPQQNTSHSKPSQQGQRAQTQAPQGHENAQKPKPSDDGGHAAGSGFSWADVT